MYNQHKGSHQLRQRDMVFASNISSTKHVESNHPCNLNLESNGGIHE